LRFADLASAFDFFWSANPGGEKKKIFTSIIEKDVQTSFSLFDRCFRGFDRSYIRYVQLNKLDIETFLCLDFRPK